MAWHTTADVDEFLGTAGEFLRSRPVENTVMLTLAETLQRRGPRVYGPEDPHFGWWTSAEGVVEGALLQTPPYPLLLSRVPPDAVPAAAELLADRSLPGVNALSADADAFAEAWQRITGCAAKIGRQSRLYRLDRLIPPSPFAAGAGRVAGEADRPLLVEWFVAFHGDIGEAARAVDEMVDDRLSYGGLTFWEVDGRPVALAGVSQPAGGTVRVSAVYTPREVRGRGYGAAVTATVTQAALDAGADDVVLFTDLANPTSNALYQRLGYRPVEDRSVVEFTA
jgi:predicted GNAT family acetyltransferase